jgi:hypothetical protein
MSLVKSTSAIEDQLLASMMIDKEKNISQYIYGSTITRHLQRGACDRQGMIP